MSSAADLLWGIPAEFVATRHDEVHVWRASLDVTLSRVESLSQLLCADERNRADGFHFERNRNNFIVGRALLRILIGRYLQKEPAQWKDTTGVSHAGSGRMSGQEHEIQLWLNRLKYRETIHDQIRRRHNDVGRGGRQYDLQGCRES